MKSLAKTVSLVAILLVTASVAHAAPRAFTLNAASIGGPPNGEVSMTGGGVFDPVSRYVRGGIGGVQNVWVQGVGCADGITHVQ